MEDMKAMARAKRASSKRGRARHSHHKHTHAPAAGAGTVTATDDFNGGATRDQNTLEGVLPTNWERYGDDGESEDEEVPDGEIRPKSKGADYSQLLSSDAPKLYEDPPELDGMFSLMLGAGLESWDGDSWLEAPSTSEQQATHDAAALLTPDLEVLGKSLARLPVAELLMVEKELLPEQPMLYMSQITVKDDEGASNDLNSSTYFRAETSVREDKQDNFRKAYKSEEIRKDEFSASPPVANGVNFAYQSGIKSGAALTPVATLPLNSGDRSLGLKRDASVARNNIVRQATRPDEGATTRETSAQPPENRKFLPAAAVADLDELLDMLDNVSQSVATSSGLRRSEAEATSTSDLSFVSDLPEGSPQFSRIDSFSGITRTSGVGSKERSEESKGAKKEVKTASAVSLDDDFDSWLDSI
ncbi:hypothetical protein R1sor_001685 [Riccia sorocarpa]|uniref:Uncharacterized protein n=1 Tax=Riccia sorocarpa TaxID=122646 RepID=A0ABD3GXG8_9MARC